jgi:galactokinase
VGTRRAREGFAATFGGEPDGVWAAPGRVNLIGEHTDYNDGLCLPIALPHRTYVALRRRGDDSVTLASAQMPGQAPWTIRLAEVGPGLVTGWGAYVAGTAWAMAQAGAYQGGGFDAYVDSCVPGGAGLSSSAALECSVAVALDETGGAGLAALDEGRARLARCCVRAENEIAGAPTGGMDQSASLLSRAGHALALDFASWTSLRVPFDPASAGLTLLIIDTRAHHALVDGQYASRREQCEQAARRLGLTSLRVAYDQVADGARSLTDILDRLGDDLLARRTRHVVTEIGRTAETVRLLQAGALDRIGPLLDASHASMRDDYEISCPELDVAVESARAAGALGARLTGGGFGGSAIALLPTDHVPRATETIRVAYAARGFTPPAFAPAPPGAGAARVDG